MAVRTVTVDLRLDAGSYLAIARSVVRANEAIDDSLNDIGASAAAAGSAMNSMGRDMQRTGARARIAERRMRELREEIARLQAQAAMGIPNMGMGGGGGSRGMAGMFANPALLGGVGIAIGAAGPAIGAAISGLILTAVGTLGLVPGIVAALQDDAVQGAFGRFGQFVSAEFKSYGEAFEVPLIDAAEHFHDRFASISPKIRGVLAEMSVAVRPLAEGLAGFIEQAGPGIAGALRGSIPVLKAIAAELPRMGHFVGEFFDIIGEGGEGAADAMYAMMRAVELTTALVGPQLLYLTTLFEQANNFGLIFGASGALMGFGRSDEKAMFDLSPASDQLYQVADAADNARMSLLTLQETMLGVSERFNNAHGSLINYEEAIDDLTASVEQNGRSMDIGSEKGRANARALMDVFAAARATYEANIASGMSAEEAARKYNAQIERAKQVARAAGLAADEVNRLAAAQNALPTGTRTFTYKTIFLTEGRSPGGVGAGGTRYAYRDGGIYAARDGLMTGAGIFTGGQPILKFAEPGVGREAFIAQNAPAGRSLAIANTAAGWHGGQVVPKGWGGGGTVVVVKPYMPTNANRDLVDAITGQIRLDVQHQSRGDVQRHLGSAGRP